MITIGEFARLGQVTVKALRHYDTLGLLKPAAIDPESGYRRYTEAQLPRLRRIGELKALGFRLEAIGPLLNEPPPSAQWIVLFWSWNPGISHIGLLWTAGATPPDELKALGFRLDAIGPPRATPRR